MTYDSAELSREDGAPVLLVTFALGEKLWRFVRGDEDRMHDGNLYIAPPGGIEPSNIRESSEVAKNDVKLVVDRSHPIAELWRLSPPTAVVAVMLVEIHDGQDGDAVSWLGHVSNVSWIGEARAEISLSPGALAMRTNGLRRLWQKGCPHVLYGPKCRLSRWGAAVDAELGMVDGPELTAAAFAADHDLAGGRLTWLEGSTAREARILEHDGATITLAAGDASLEAGLAVQVFPSLHQVRIELTAIVGLELVADELANGMKFNGGFIEWTDADGVTDWRSITYHAGTTIRLMTAAPRLEVGMHVVAVEGCERTLTRCDELDNRLNYGGIPYFINKNPFGPDPVY